MTITTVDDSGIAVSGEIFVDGESVGTGSWSGSVASGDYTIAFGDLPGYLQPSDQTATVVAGQTTTIEGVYLETQCFFENVLVNGSPYNGERIGVNWDGGLYVEFDFIDGMFWDAWATCDPPIFGPDHGDGEGHFSFMLADPGTFCEYDETLYFYGTGYFGDCQLVIYWGVGY